MALKAPRGKAGDGRRQTIIRLIRIGLETHDRAPTVEEMAKTLACSPERIRLHLAQLQKDGEIPCSRSLPPPQPQLRLL